MPKETIFVVEDEEDILELIKYNLNREGYDVTGFKSGEDVLQSARVKNPDLIVLDIMLPGIDGLNVCKKLKNDPKTSHIPIIMLTAKSEEIDVVTGLELGADDYISKPFSLRVLIARIRNVLRRKSPPPEENSTSPIKIENLVIHPGRHEVRINDTPVDLTRTEFQILYFLARQPGWVFSRYQIVNSIHGDDYAVTDRSVDVQIVGLRRKLGAYGEKIETVRGVGYRFKE